MRDPRLENPFKLSLTERRTATKLIIKASNEGRLAKALEPTKTVKPSKSVMDACIRYIAMCKRWEKENKGKSLGI